MEVVILILIAIAAVAVERLLIRPALSPIFPAWFGASS